MSLDAITAGGVSDLTAREDEITARAEAAPGPWTFDGVSDSMKLELGDWNDGQVRACLDFIANAHDDIVWLLARVRELEAALRDAANPHLRSMPGVNQDGTVSTSSMAETLARAALASPVERTKRAWRMRVSASTRAVFTEDEAVAAEARANGWTVDEYIAASPVERTEGDAP